MRKSANHSQLRLLNYEFRICTFPSKLKKIDAFTDFHPEDKVANIRA